MHSSSASERGAYLRRRGSLSPGERGRQTHPSIARFGRRKESLLICPACSRNGLSLCLPAFDLATPPQGAPKMLEHQELKTTSRPSSTNLQLLVSHTSSITTCFLSTSISTRRTAHWINDVSDGQMTRLRSRSIACDEKPSRVFQNDCTDKLCEYALLRWPAATER